MRSLPHLLYVATVTSALQIDINDVHTIAAAAQVVATSIVGIYNGETRNSTAIPGLFPTPYYWGESGLAWDSLVEYWSPTGDDSWNDIISEALIWQTGTNHDYMPSNQTSDMGNDDQSTWALAALTAAEVGFPAPKSGPYGSATWLDLAKNVFDDQVQRWDTKTCGGGLRWEIYSFTNGYDYKNSITNGNFAQLAARLAVATGNQTYADWASKTLAWSYQSGLIDKKTFQVWDGASTSNDCRTPSKLEWTIDFGTYLSAYAYLSAANSSIPDHTAEMLDRVLKTFAVGSNSVLEEVACQSTDYCSTNELADRAVLARALANVKYRYAPKSGITNVNISELTTVMRNSAKGAAAQCSGGANGNTCGSDWTSSKWDGTSGLGQDLSALEILLANIPRQTVSHTAGGASTTTGTTSGPSPTGAAGSSGAPVQPGGASSLTRDSAGLLSAALLTLAWLTLC